MFQPLRCPYPSCRFHLHPPPLFCVRRGVYRPRCRNHPVQRFLCRACGRSFSRQTFRADFRHKKPHLNAPFLRLMVSCVAMRQAARFLQVARRTIEHRFRWLARHAANFQSNHLPDATLAGPFQLDELESFESNRFQPVTVPVLIDRTTFFLVATAVGPLRRKGRLTSSQRQRRALHEARQGRRPTHSRRAVGRVLRRLLPLTPPGAPVVLESDRKPLYGQMGRALFGSRFRWRPHPASGRRDRSNPLFPINHTNAWLRHFLSRLRRRSWCISKRRENLQSHLVVAALWVNYCRGITNRTSTTPAQALGLVAQPFRVEEVLAWRQDWRTLGPGTA